MIRFALFPVLWLLFSPLAGAQRSGDADLKAIIDQVRPSTVTIQVRGRDGGQIGLGTGFAIDSTGLLATNFHVITEGRPLTVEMASGRQLPVLAIEASDRRRDLAIIRVDVGENPLPALKLSDAPLPDQGTQVLAFGNPLGLRDSVVTGIVSAVREMDGRPMIQLAMPTQPGNSGGPLVDLKGNVVGIVNMKSAVDDNLGFAIPSDQLNLLSDQPNPISIARWVRLGQIDPETWTPLFGASWTQRGSILNAQGLGTGFGGRSLLLSNKNTLPNPPFEIAVDVRLDDESGAAGLAFLADGKDKHYGFYPSDGKLRLTCFQGPSVYSWQVLEEVESDHYLPGEWNRIRVRVDTDKLLCYLNGKLVIESNDRQLSGGKVGLVKFRDTKPAFKRFQFGDQLQLPTLSAPLKTALANLIDKPDRLVDFTSEQRIELGRARHIVNREISREVSELEQRISQLRRVAEDLELVPTLRELENALREEETHSDRLLRATLAIAKLDQPDLDIGAYVDRVQEMTCEIRDSLTKEANSAERRDALHRFLFQENGFRGGRAEYYHPANSHLNQVIDDREGLPITLSILYMSLGQALDLDMQGVGLPGHFVVRDATEEPQVLIDVFEQGNLLSREDANRLVTNHSGRPLNDADLLPQNVQQILTRVLSNLVGGAGRRQDLSAIHRYCEALVIVDPDSIESRRMRAQVRMMTERDAAALADFDYLIENETSTAAYHEAMALRNQLIQRIEPKSGESKSSQPDSGNRANSIANPDRDVTPNQASPNP
ncbi:MAG: transglutaminase family protein [Rubripirellula sp.]|nr:transglutaminase family protein [Rubripirellula sp.]